MESRKGDRIGVQRNDEKRGRGRIGRARRSNVGSQPVCEEQRGEARSGYKTGGLMSHDIVMSKASMANTRAG